MNVSTQSLQTALAERSRHVHPATAQDAVAGVTPSMVIEPETDEEVAAVLRFADAEGLAVLVRGGGTHLAMGSPPGRGDILLSTARLSAIVDHAPHDLTVSVQAGLPLGDLQAALGQARQWLALDPAVPPSATIGGLIATNVSGAHRLRYGGVRDQLIGLRVALPDGTIAKGGGKVVKNVAGYDLPKLYTGALGTLGVIVGATFRLYPRLPYARTVVLPASTPEPLGELAVRAINSTLVPAVVDMFGPGLAPDEAACALVMRFESGVEASVTEQAAALLGMADALAARALTLEGEDESALWRNADAALPTGDARDGSLLVKVSLLPAEVGPWLAALAEHTSSAGVTVTWRAHAGHGLVFARLDGDNGSDQETLARAVRTLRQEAEVRKGTVVVLDGQPELLRQIDVWGPIPALDVMRRIKARFDPNGILNPGRFVGGI
jgi:glycolate oxidase FAD binding subunit